MKATQFAHKDVEFIGGKITENAFLPHKSGADYGLSVNDTEGIDENEIWRRGQIVQDVKNGLRARFGRSSNLMLLGRGDVTRALFEDEGLKIEPLNDGIPGHLNVTGWPSREDEKQLLAQIFASKAVSIRFI